MSHSNLAKKNPMEKKPKWKEKKIQYSCVIYEYLKNSIQCFI